MGGFTGIKTKQVALHLLGSLAFLAIPILMSPDFLEGRRFLMVGAFQREMLLQVLVLCFFYGNYYLLLPKFYFGGRRWAYFAIVSATFLVLLVVPALLVGAGPRPAMALPPGMRPPGGLPRPFEYNPMVFTFRFLASGLIMYLMVIFFSLSIRVNGRLKAMEQAHLAAQLAYLKSQINPHFLFNTLNGIYAMAIEGHALTADAIVKLSGMMRFVLSEAGQDFVALDKELGYIQDYVDLQRLRLLDTVDLQLAMEGDGRGKKIAPLILISFIENAFKHGLNPEEEAVIDIAISVENSSLQLQVVNRKVTRVALGPSETGLGIDNARQRLQLQYPGKHLLRIEEDEIFYRVWLNIDL